MKKRWDNKKENLHIAWLATTSTMAVIFICYVIATIVDFCKYLAGEAP